MPDGFWQDLKRRRVVRVAAAYVAIAFAVLEGAELVFPRLGLPDRALTVLVILATLGFPAALVLSWLFDLSPEGVVRMDKVSPEEGAVPAAPTRGRVLRLSVLAAGSVGFAFGAWLWIPRAPGFGTAGVDPSTLVVFPFSVRGGEDIAYLQAGMVDLFSTSLDGVGGLRVVDPNVSLAQLGPEPGSGRDPSELADLAATLGAGRALVGSVVWVGGSVQLGATVYGPGFDDRVEESAAGSAAELFSLVDEVVARLVAKGVIERSTQLSSLEGLTTRSNEGLRLYLEGIQNFRLGLPRSATFEPLSRAVALDSTFALASYWAGYVADYEGLGDPLDFYLQASRHQNRLGQRDRLRLGAALAGAEGRHADAIRLYEAFVARHPDDLAGWFQLGEELAHSGAYTARTDSDARAVYERVISLDPAMAPAYYHLTVIAALEGDTSALGSWAGYLESAGADMLDIDIARMERALLLGDTSAARTHFERARLAEGDIPPSTLATSFGQLMGAVMTDSPRGARTFMAEFAARAVTDTARAEGARRSARIEAAEGRFAEAAAALGVSALTESTRSQDRAWIALHPSSGDETRIASSYDALVAIEPTPDTGEAAARSYLLARLALERRRSGMTDRHRQALAVVVSRAEDESTARFASDLLAELDAHVVRASGDSEGALTRLLAASYWERSQPWLGHRAPTYLTDRLADRAPMFLRAELLREAGRDAEAAMWYRVAAEGVWFRRPALLGLAEILGRQGAVAQAAELRARADRLWDGGNPP